MIAPDRFPIFMCSAPLNTGFNELRAPFAIPELCPLKNERPRVDENLIIYRDALLPLSETFVLAQGEALSRYRAHYVGQRRAPGLSPPGDRTHIIGDAFSTLPARAAFKLYGRIPETTWAALRGLAPALVHAHFGTASPEAMWLADALGIPCVVTFHGYDATINRSLRNATPSDLVSWLLRRRIRKRIAAFVAVSDFIAQCLLARGYPAEKVIRHYVGIDVGAFSYRGPEGRGQTFCSWADWFR